MLFVCQPSYSATRRRLVQRMLGTFAGLLVGILCSGCSRNCTYSWW